MRGKPDYQAQIYYSIDIESWIPEDHPLRAVKQRSDAVLSQMRGARWPDSRKRTRQPSPAPGATPPERQGLSGLAAHSEAGRGDHRLEQDDRRPPAQPARRSLEDRSASPHRERRVQPAPHREAGTPLSRLERVDTRKWSCQPVLETAPTPRNPRA